MIIDHGGFFFSVFSTQCFELPGHGVKVGIRSKNLSGT
ncbi:hypothetical protein C4K39_1558 [Pseudomonas sessilinigenes]|nr:hypothetical protein C4K39_1558 [Pseudomonas sessilinigenes]